MILVYQYIPKAHRGQSVEFVLRRDQSSTEPQYCYRSVHVIQTMTFNKNPRCSGFWLYVAYPATALQCVGSARTALTVDSSSSLNPKMSHLGFSHFWFPLVVVISSNGSQREHNWSNYHPLQTLFALKLIHFYSITPCSFKGPVYKQRCIQRSECTLQTIFNPNFPLSLLTSRFSNTCSCFT